MPDTSTLHRKFEVHGWCIHLQHHWPVASEVDDQVIRADAAFSSPLKVKTPSGERLVHTATLRLRASAAANAPAGAHEVEEIVFGKRPGGTLYLELDSATERINCELTVGLAQAEFLKLWSGLSETLALELGGALSDVDYFHPLELTDNHLARPLQQLKLRAASEAPVPPSWFLSRQTSDYQEALSREHLPGSRGTQFARIVQELSESAAQSGLNETSRNYCIESARQILQGLRSAFRQPVSLTDDQYANIWNLGPAEFEKTMEGSGEPRTAQLRQQYGQLWQHFSVSNVVKQGEESTGAGKEGFRPHVEEIENCAAELLANPRLSSATLEWALVNALIYAECIAFAQTRLSGQAVFGMVVPGELKGLATPKAVGRQFITGLAKSGAAAIVEVLKIGMTFAVATVLAQDNPATAWVITTGITAARWVRNGLTPQPKAAALVHLELLSKMASVHDLLKTVHFNSRSVRQALYLVAADGAVFSPWVFNLLDARIRRER